MYQLFNQVPSMFGITLAATFDLFWEKLIILIFLGQVKL